MQEGREAVVLCLWSQYDVRVLVIMHHRKAGFPALFLRLIVRFIHEIYKYACRTSEQANKSTSTRKAADVASSDSW